MSKPIRLFVTWLIETFSLLFLAYFGFGLTLARPGSALVAIGVIGLLNAFVRPLIIKLTLPITAITMGLFSLLINAFILLFAARLLPGLEIASWGWAIGISIGLTILNTLISYLLNINDDDSYYYGVIKKAAKHAPDTVKTDKPGFFYLEADGLGYQVLKKALKQGLMPQLQAYLTQNHYQIIPWETDLSSQTCASQAGILLGNNSNIPAFRWYDRKAGRLVTASVPKEALSNEQARSNGQGLLAQNGVSINNMFSGDAQDGVLTLSMMLKKKDKRSQLLYYYFINPYNYAHTLSAVFREMLSEWRDARYAKKNNTKPAISHRGLEFVAMRAILNVYLQDIAFAVAIGALLSGKDHIYLTSPGYDDIAHHTGFDSRESLQSLQKMDTYLSHLFKTIADAPRPYHFIFLSDHGQSNGPSFQSVYGHTLGELVNQNLSQNVHAAEITDRDESYGNTNKLLTEVTHQFRPQSAQTTSVGKEAKELKLLTGDGKRGDLPPILVMSSGNLGLINYTGTKERLTLEEIAARQPKLIKALVNHPGISFIMVKTKTRGTVVMGKKGTYYLQTDKIEGENPVKDFSPNMVKHLKHHDSFPHIPDILLNSYYNPKTQEVYAFEDFVGSHGGAGGPQSEPFLAYPASLPAPKTPIIGAENIFKLLKSWQTS